MKDHRKLHRCHTSNIKCHRKHHHTGQRPHHPHQFPHHKCQDRKLCQEQHDSPIPGATSPEPDHNRVAQPNSFLCQSRAP